MNECKMKTFKEFLQAIEIGEKFTTGCSDCEGGELHVKLSENSAKCLNCEAIVAIK